MRNYGIVYEGQGKIIAFNNREFRSRTEMEAYAHAMDTVAGRELDWQELTSEFGIHKLSMGQQARLANWRPKMANVGEDFKLGRDNPFETEAARQLAERDTIARGHRVDRAKMMREAAKKWNAEHDVKAEAAAELASRERTIRAASQLQDRVRFDPTAAVDDVIQAVQAARAASTPGADLDEVKRLVSEAIDAETRRIEVRKEGLRGRITDLQKQLDGRERPDGPEPSPSEKLRRDIDERAE